MGGEGERGREGKRERGRGGEGGRKSKTERKREESVLQCFFGHTCHNLTKVTDFHDKSWCIAV